MVNKDEIIKLLTETDSYVSGQELCERYSVSRTAIWKVIKQLEKEGYEVEAVQNKGYRIHVNDDIFSKTEIIRNLETRIMGRNLIFHKVTGSTNIDAANEAANNAPHGTTVVADMQDNGKGRRGRAWITSPGEAISISILLRPDCEPDKASQITLVMALAIVEALEEICPGKCGIKWPNDIVIDGKKVCGILTEMSAEIDAIHYVIPGSGINVNQTSFEGDIANTATSLYIETGRKINRSHLVARILYFFEKYYEEFEKTYDLGGLVDRYNNCLVNCGRQVRVLDPKKEFEGKALGINSSGELLVKTEDGNVVEVYAGEVSVRGVYGYV